MTLEELHALIKDISPSELTLELNKTAAKNELMTNHVHYWENSISRSDEKIRTYVCATLHGCLATMTLPQGNYAFSVRKFYWDGQEVTPEDLGVQRP